MIDNLNAKKDIIIISIITIVLWFFLSSIDAFELMLEYLEEHEDYELDEVLLLFILLGLMAIIFSIRRVAEANKINKQLKDMNCLLEKKVNDEIARRREKESLLLQQTKMASMGEMIGNIAHQWRQPLNALGLVMQNIKFSYEMNELDDKFMSNSVKKVNMLTKSMSKTIDDFRNFYKPNKSKNKFDLNDIVADSLNLIESSFEHYNIKLEYKKTNEIEVFGYSNEFSQTILNILNNAKDAINENNTKNAKVKLEVNNDKSYGYVIIKDNAGGIPTDIIHKIFEPYFTTKDEGKGTGIGLYMSKIIIEQNMNGKLEVKNIDNGAEFIVKVPLYEELS